MDSAKITLNLEEPGEYTFKVLFTGKVVLVEKDFHASKTPGEPTTLTPRLKLDVNLAAAVSGYKILFFVYVANE